MNYILFQKRSVTVRPKWRRVGRVERLLLFPLKSGQPVDVSEAEMSTCGMRTNTGLKDRSFMVVDADTGGYFDVRSNPRLILVKLDVVGTGEKYRFFFGIS